MGFLYPGFLFALAAIAIPVVVHLFNFRKFKKVYFSNVQFLKEAREQNFSRDKLKHLLVLVARILAVIFLVLAFSRPFISADPTVNNNLQTAVSIYIDNSYSMESVNKEGSLLDEAKRRAKELVKAFGVNDRFRLTTNDFEGRHQRWVSAEEFISLLDDIKISPIDRSLQQVINRQFDGSSSGTNRFSYLISDFQRNFVSHAALKLDSSVHTSFVKLNANVLPNVAVDSVWFLSPLHKPGGMEKLVVQTRNYTDKDAIGVPLKLTIGRQQRAINTINIPAEGIRRDTLSFSDLKSGWQQGMVALKDFPVAFDDQLRFTFKVAEDLKVLSIKGTPGEKYIKALFSADPYFKLTEMPESNIRYAELASYNLIVLDGLQAPSSGLAQELKGFLQKGGSVVIFPDLDADMHVYSAFLNGLTLPSVIQLNKEILSVNAIDLKHEVFKDVFEQIPNAIDLPEVKRYFGYARQSQRNWVNLLQLPPNKLFFGEFMVGDGKIYLSAVSVDTKDSNLPVHPIFVPLMYKIAFGSSVAPPLYYTLGKDELLESARISLTANESLKMVSEDFEVIPELRQTPGHTSLYIADQVKKSGYYTLKKGDTILAVFAFNDNRKESDMNYTTEQELKKLSDANKGSVYDLKRDSLPTGNAAKNNSTELWKLCLVLCAVFLGVEILLIRFFNKTKIIPKHESSSYPHHDSRPE